MNGGRLVDAVDRLHVSACGIEQFVGTGGSDRATRESANRPTDRRADRGGFRSGHSSSKRRSAFGPQWSPESRPANERPAFERTAESGFCFGVISCFGDDFLPLGLCRIELLAHLADFRLIENAVFDCRLKPLRHDIGRRVVFTTGRCELQIALFIDRVGA